ncbi:MAG: hypothetical protein WC538_02950 [Thermoanaerobaculia bacterium]|jgi:hypothetical protein
MTVIRRVSVLIVSFLCLVPAVAILAAPAPATPEELVRLVYADHQPWAGKAIAWEDSAVLAKYCDASLVELFKKDGEYSARMQEVGCLDGDPFLDAQDYDEKGITPPKIRKVKGKSGDLYEVTFTGLSDAWKNWNVRLQYDVRKTPEGWRIHDIIFKNGDSLRKIFACNQK